MLLSHLHGDHFGGLPFLLLDGQFEGERTRPLTVVGPVGTGARLQAALEVFFPGSSSNAWRYRAGGRRSAVPDGLPVRAS